MFIIGLIDAYSKFEAADDKSGMNYQNTFQYLFFETYGFRSANNNASDK